jgi:nucleosome binding factor SPN SPT16 subunit
MVLIHFHLKHEILIGKKKHKDIQFYTDVIDASQNLDGARRSMYDPDELEEEQRERMLRKRLNEAFRDFSKKVEKVAKEHDYDVEFDTPYRDLGFTGTPFKEMVTLMPTVRCLVSLTETPFLVIDLDEVEHVHFERVSFNQKTFDMIIIFKDFKRPVQPINLIDKNSLPDIQEWLTHSGITYTAGPRSLNWKTVMEAVREDPFFFEDHDETGEKQPPGWLSLSAEHEDEEEDEEEDADSAYSEDAEGSDEEDESDEDDSESDFADEDESEEEEEEESEEGESWEELERQAKAADKAKRDHEEDERPASRKKARR